MTRFEVGLLINFGPQASFKRKAFDNTRKGSFPGQGHIEMVEKYQRLSA